MRDKKEFKASLEIARAERMENVKKFIERKCHLTNEERLELLNIIADESLINWGRCAVKGEIKGTGGWDFNFKAALDGIDRIEKRTGIENGSGTITWSVFTDENGNPVESQHEVPDA